MLSWISYIVEMIILVSFGEICFRMPMMGPMGNMGGPPQMNMGMSPGSNQPQQNKPLFPSAAVVCIHSFDVIWIDLNTSYS